MAKMRIFKFWNESGQEEEKLVGFEYISKKGKKIVSSIQLPLGRKKKIGR